MRQINDKTHCLKIYKRALLIRTKLTLSYQKTLWTQFIFDYLSLMLHRIMMLCKIYGILNSMNYSVALCSFKVFMLFSALYISPPYSLRISLGCCLGKEMWTLHLGMRVSLFSRQRSFSKLRTVYKQHLQNEKLEEMGNVMTIFPICCFSGFTLLIFSNCFSSWRNLLSLTSTICHSFSAVST